jgi:ketosteroid isomerase-like protein
MQKLIIVLALGILSAGWAVASDKSDAEAVVNQWTDHFNQGDLKAAIALCAPDASIIDDLAPFHWRGPGACAKWSEAYAVYVKDQAITDVMVTLDPSHTIDVSGDRAYFGARATYVGTQKGKPLKVRARVTMVLQKEGRAGWQIAAWSWSE